MQPQPPKDQLIRPNMAQIDEAKLTPPPLVTLEKFQTLERAILEMPLNVDPYIELGEIYLQATRWTDARRVLEIATVRFPDDLQAQQLLEEAQLSRTQELIDKAEEEHQREPTQLTLEALQRCQLEQCALREKIYRQRLERHPEQVELMIPLAETLDRLEQRDQAIAMLKKASQIPKLRAEASLQLGRLLERALRVPDALSAYRRAALFRVPPPSPDVKLAALAYAADLALRSGMFDSARRYLELLLEIAPQNQLFKQRLNELHSQPL